MKITRNKKSSTKLKMKDLPPGSFFVCSSEPELFLKISHTCGVVQFMHDGPYYHHPGQFDPNSNVWSVSTHDVSITFSL